MTAPPTVDHRAIEALVKDQLQHHTDRRLLLVHARYTDTVDSFPLSRHRRRVHVADRHSVLGMVEAWQRHLSEHAADDDLLVLTTSVPDEQLCWDLRAYAIKRSIRNVDRARIVAQRFGAVDVDARVRTEDWLIDGLLDAEPPTGWPRIGSVLTRDRVIRALIAARLGRSAAADGTLDVGTLLEWSRGPEATRFAELASAERDGIACWLNEAVGPAAAVLFRLVQQGKAADAMPLGVVASAATGSNPRVEVGLALGGLLGGAHGSGLSEFTKAVEGTLSRWVHEAVVNRNGAVARRRVWEIVRRADEIAAQVGITDALRENRFLPSAFTARLRELAAIVSDKRASTGDAECELVALRDHAVAQLSPGRLRVAEMAVRLRRWAQDAETAITSVNGGLAQHVAETAWVDRAMHVLWHGDPGGDAIAGQAYRTVWQEVRGLRDRIDEAFAARLAPWAQHARDIESGGALLIEQVLGEIVAPVARKAAPLVIVLDGMSGAVATSFGEQITEWAEVSREAGQRVAAAAAMPSVTQISRASLLTGTITEGGQAAEKDGFEKFWRARQRQARLFHKADIEGPAGSWLSDELFAALSESRMVVGVVLNTLDDALDHGQEGGRVEWQLEDVTYLSTLLNEARNYGRPVVLTSDHGHVLDRGGPQSHAEGVESARWRRGTPGSGEVALHGPRVVPGDLVAPWREDLHYTPRKAGYHGGASLAEMTVPVLVLLPSLELLPDGWNVLSRERVEPSWWSACTVHAEPEPPAAPAPSRRKERPDRDAEGLFTVDAAPAASASSLGESVVAAEVYERQRRLVPRPPDKRAVAAVIDALAAQPDERLTTSAVAAAAGRAARRPEFFISTVSRLLNVDGYPILSIVDNGARVKLDAATLRLQFEVDAP